MSAARISDDIKEISANKYYWQKTDISQELTALIVVSTAAFLNILSPIENQTPAFRFLSALIFGLVLAISLHLIVAVSNFLVVKNGSYYSLDTSVSRLSDLSDAQSILWRKVKKELTPVELENFKGVLPSFEGSIKELMEVSKTV